MLVSFSWMVFFGFRTCFSGYLTASKGLKEHGWAKKLVRLEGLLQDVFEKSHAFEVDTFKLGNNLCLSSQRFLEKKLTISTSACLFTHLCVVYVCLIWCRALPGNNKQHLAHLVSARIAFRKQLIPTHPAAPKLRFSGLRSASLVKHRIDSRKHFIWYVCS